MTLNIYHQKRNFNRTPEPYGKNKSKQGKPIYLVQKHAASHLHYDFRLELGGVLKSWAIPKGPSLDPKVKRLAVHVEDHPLEYRNFEGVIPAGEYGGGTVMLWDTGTWQLDGSTSPLQAYKKGTLTFVLHGRKLQGSWKLIRIKSDPKNWLLIKINDNFSRGEKGFAITDVEPNSVVSGNNLAEIAKKLVKPSTARKLRKKGCSSLSSLLSKIKENLMPTPMPNQVFPQLATLVSHPPNGAKWLHEIKLDGYRLLCFIREQKISLITRGQKDWTRKFSHLAEILAAENLPDLIFDGEVVVLTKSQRSNFQLLQNALEEHKQQEIIYYVFDLLYYKNWDLTSLPLIERKALLQQIILNLKEKTFIRYSEHLKQDSDSIFKKACKLQLEGIVSKLASSVYVQARTKQWQKAKCIKRQELVVGGYTQPKGSRAHFGSLLLGYYVPSGALKYCGHVGTGFTNASLEKMANLLKQYETEASFFLAEPSNINNVIWVKPKLVVEVEFAEWTQDKILRHPSFKGLRTDKNAAEIILEEPKEGEL